jgi:hypothetical protein
MAAQNGTLFITSMNGRTHAIDFYSPDATGTNLTFNPSGLSGSGSQAQMVVPVTGFITDVSIAAAPTNVGANFQLDSASIPGNTLRWANQLSTLNNRPKLRMPVKQGQILTALTF